MKKFVLISALISCVAGCYTAISPSNNDQKSVNEVTSLRPTNILWIFIEDQNAWNNAYGDNTVNTPTIKAFARSGVRFNNTIQPAPVCSATRSALVTGQYQTSLGVHQHRSYRSSYNGHFLPEGYKTVPELFSDAGYATFNIGKDDYNFKYDRSKLYTAHDGKAGYQGEHEGVKFDWANKLKNKPFFGQIQLRGGKHHFSKNDNVPPKTSIDVTLPPYYPDTPAIKEAWQRHYQTQVKSDQELAGILEQLKQNGLLENTAIFWFADHGMELLRHKQELYEDGVKVPFIVNWPAGNHLLQQKGAVRNELISGLDIPATSLALAGISIPEHFDGKDLFSRNFTGREFAISAKDRMDSTFDRSRAVRTKRYRYIRHFYPHVPKSQPQYRDGRNYSIEPRQLHESGKLTPEQAFYYAPIKLVEELYDLESDPHQVNNLSTNPKYRKELLEHRQILLNWIAKTDDKGAYPESDKAIKETLDMWGKKCVSVACNSYRKRHKDTLHIPGDKLYPPVKWPDYMPKPVGSYYEEAENIFTKKFQ